MTGADKLNLLSEETAKLQESHISAESYRGEAETRANAQPISHQISKNNAPWQTRAIET